MRSVKRNNGQLHFLKRVGVLCATLLWVVVFGSPHLLAADTDVNVKVCYPTPDPAPTITSPPDGTTTTSSSILLSGQATANVPVYIYRNSAQVGFVTAANDGSFATSVSLVVGSNALQASTNNDCHTPTYSNTVNVTRETVTPPPAPPSPSPTPTPPTPTPSPETSPQIPGGTASPQPTDTTPGKPKQPPTKQPAVPTRAPVILEPQDGKTVHEPFIFVVGETTPNTVVRILRNDQTIAQVTSDDKGRFSVKIPLDPGTNRLMIASGLLFSKTVTVTYEPPRPGILPHWLIWTLLIIMAVLLIALTYILIWQPVLARRIWRKFTKRKSRKP